MCVGGGGGGGDLGCGFFPCLGGGLFCVVVVFFYWQSLVMLKIAILFWEVPCKEVQLLQ